MYTNVVNWKLIKDPFENGVWELEIVPALAMKYY
jgi:hypothetical protein